MGRAGQYNLRYCCRSLQVYKLFCLEILKGIARTRGSCFSTLAAVTFYGCTRRSPDLNRRDGSTTRKRVPAPTFDSTSRRPPCASTISRHVKRPRPMPLFFVVEKGRNSRVLINSSLIPVPVSATLTKT